MSRIRRPEPNTGQVPANIDPELSNFLMSVKNGLDYLLGTARGTDLSKAARMRDLLDIEARLKNLQSDVDGIDTSGGSTIIPEPIWIDASQMIAATTNGATKETIELPTNDVDLDVMTFGSASDEIAQFKFGVPQGWDGSVSYRLFYMFPSTEATNIVKFDLNIKRHVDDDALDSSWESAGTKYTQSADTAYDLYITSAATISITPADEQYLLIWKIKRDTSYAWDPSISVHLLGVLIEFDWDNS